MFNTKVQSGFKNETKLVCWLSLPRTGQSQRRIDFLLPHRVATRYLTVVFIESENYMGMPGDCNVDIQWLVVDGNLVKLEGVLA
jgi:hypothetical protein